MRKIILSIILVISMITVTGCVETDSAKVRAMSEEIMQCFINKDVETLKNMFSPAILTMHDDIDEQIQNAFDFIDGEIISYRIPTAHNMHKQTDGGKATLHTIQPRISNIETVEGKIYRIYYAGQLANAKNEDRVGLTGLRVDFDDGTSCNIGGYPD
ncbi:MAG: DUF5104 domain-containing protein [Oscillospiraceae bacterium]|nr:DUF5104 domain-containing protein [Oscillospiraceae bacterium]